MEFIIQISIVIEIILVIMNLYSNHSIRKYSYKFTIFVIIIFTIFLILIFYSIMRLFSFYGNGNGIFTLYGLFYLLPLHYLFKSSLKRNIFIICFAWIYTLVIFSIAVQIGYIFEQFGRFDITLVSQTILFMISYKFVSNFMSDTYITLLTTTQANVQPYLLKGTYLWFITLFTINLNFIFMNNSYLKIIAFIILSSNIIFSYIMIKQIFHNGQAIGDLQTILLKDSLTKIGNRSLLYQDIEKQIGKSIPFTLFFIDLNNFKMINDTYGHLCGDSYLCEFAQILNKLCIKEHSCCYRISGDEFIVLYKKETIETMISKINEIDFVITKYQAKYKGASIGFAMYPNEGRTIDSLIYLADKRMYEYKQKMK